jgi:hypothetical protein
VPSTGALTTTTFIGALTGNASTATNIAGGAATRVPFQSAASTTTFSTDYCRLVVLQQIMQHTIVQAV